ncbi:MAG: hypothetical protein ACE5GX_01105 [Thermoanaerobaculia bacterium]
MLTFASLLLGLTLGVQGIEILAEDEIVSVEVFLDGASQGRLTDRPYLIECDFGEELAPHELVAVGYDGEGKPLARAVQWINLPRQPAEITAIFEQGSGPSTGLVARLRWAALAETEAPVARAWFDGAELVVENPESIVLPSHDPEQLHFFRAELTFPGRVVSSFEATLGGTYAENVRTELTAVLLRLGRRKEPSIAELQGALTKAGVALDVVAVDKPPAQIVVVRDRALDEEFAMLESQRSFGTALMGRLGSLSPVGPSYSNAATRVDRIMAKHMSDWRLEFLWPVPERRLGSAGREFDLFSHSPELGPDDGSLYAFLTRIDFPAHLTGPQRLADSLAVAGLSAAALGGRRTAVLILGREADDASGLSVDLVRRYLGQIQVPLEVWTTAKKGVTSWGKADRILPRARLDSEWRSLLEDLSRQRITWVRGSHLPQSIELAPIKGVELVR